MPEERSHLREKFQARTGFADCGISGILPIYCFLTFK